MVKVAEYHRQGRPPTPASLPRPEQVVLEHSAVGKARQTVEPRPLLQHREQQHRAHRRANSRQQLGPRERLAHKINGAQIDCSCSLDRGGEIGVKQNGYRLGGMVLLQPPEQLLSAVGRQPQLGQDHARLKDRDRAQSRDDIAGLEDLHLPGFQLVSQPRPFAHGRLDQEHSAGNLDDVSRGRIPVRETGSSQSPCIRALETSGGSRRLRHHRGIGPERGLPSKGTSS